LPSDYAVSGWAESLFSKMKRDRATFLFRARGPRSVRVVRQSFPPGRISELAFWETLQKVRLLDCATLFGLPFQFGGFGEEFHRRVPYNSECFHKKLYCWLSQHFRFL
jgi:hypothetical protein